MDRGNENQAGEMVKKTAVKEAAACRLDQGIFTDFLKENRSGD